MGRLRMGALESAVMEVLWDAAGHLTPAQVQDALTRDQDRPLAYTTVMTILVRLWEKGRLDRERRGRAYAYRAKLSMEEFAAGKMSDFLGNSKDRPLALSYFVAGLRPNDRRRLRQMLENDGG